VHSISDAPLHAWRCSAVFSASNCRGLAVSTPTAYSECARLNVGLGFGYSGRFLALPNFLQEDVINGKVSHVLNSLLRHEDIGRCGGVSPRILIFGTWWRWCVSFTFRAFHFLGKRPTGGLWLDVLEKEKIFWSLLAIELWFFSRVPSPVMDRTQVVFLAQSCTENKSCSQPSHVPNKSRVPSPVMYRTQVVFLVYSCTEHKSCSQPSHVQNTSRVPSPLMYRTQVVFPAQSCTEHKSCSQPSHVPNTIFRLRSISESSPQLRSKPFPIER
jgi:hypothetical protein